MTRGGVQSQTTHHRRGSLLTLGLAVWTLSPVGCTTNQAGRDSERFCQPGEFEPQEAVWMSAQPENPAFMRITADMASAFLPHAKVKMVVSDVRSLAETRPIWCSDLPPTGSGFRFERSSAASQTSDAIPALDQPWGQSLADVGGCAGHEHRG